MDTNNQIVYKTRDNSRLDIRKDSSLSTFGADLISSLYVEGEGVLVFDNLIQKIGEEAFYGLTLLTNIVVPAWGKIDQWAREHLKEEKLEYYLKIIDRQSAPSALSSS